MLNTYIYHSSLSLEETVEKLKTNLMALGFGTLCAINLNERFAAKQLNYDEKLMILEVCNPLEAHGALKVDQEAIYLLPCKIIVKEAADKVSVSMIRPSALMHLLGHDRLNTFAQSIENTMIQAIEQI